MLTGWPTRPVTQDQVETPKASVTGAASTAVQVTAAEGSTVGPVIQKIKHKEGKHAVQGLMIYQVEDTRGHTVDNKE